MDIEGLVKGFRNMDLSGLNAYSKFISTQDESGIFPPYIPFVGKNYSPNKILIYAMAQNVRQNDKYFQCLKNLTDEQKTKRLFNASDYKDIAMSPYSSGVLPALAGMYLYAKHNMAPEDFNDIQGQIAVTNYYKFSLNEGSKDINPEELNKYCDAGVYWDVNNKLCKKELECQRPNVILSFKGRHNDFLQELGYDPHIISDPSYILHGGPGKGYIETANKVTDEKAIELAENYSKKCDGRYRGKRSSVKIYLLKYYYDWCQ